MIHKGITGRDTVKANHLTGWCGPGTYECDMTMYFASISTLDELKADTGLVDTRCWPLTDYDFTCLGMSVPVTDRCRTEWMTLMDGPNYRGKLPTRVRELYDAQVTA